MTIRINVVELEKGPSLKLMFSIMFSNDQQSWEEVSKEFNINNLAWVKFKFVFKNTGSCCPCSFSLMKDQSAKNYIVKLTIVCETTGYFKEFICTEEWTNWITLDREFYVKNTQQIFSYSIAMSVIKLEPISFANLYDDTDFCDFRLSTADGSGSVDVHKVCLISHSVTFKGMLSSKWKETEAGCIEIKKVTLKTLQNLKKYIYLGTLPDTEDDICQLLLLARCYLMKNLREECIATLAREVKPENLKKLQEFAIDSKMPELMSAITYFTPDETIKTAHKIEVEKQASSENDGK